MLFQCKIVALCGQVRLEFLREYFWLWEKKKKIFTSTINEESFILSQFLDKIDRSNFSNELKLFAPILRKDYFYFKGALFPVHNKYTKLYYFYFRHSCVKNSAILSTTTLQSFPSPPSQISPLQFCPVQNRNTGAKSNSRCVSSF